MTVEHSLALPSLDKSNSRRTDMLNLFNSQSETHNMDHILYGPLFQLDAGDQDLPHQSAQNKSGQSASGAQDVLSQHSCSDRHSKRHDGYHASNSADAVLRIAM